MNAGDAAVGAAVVGAERKTGEDGLTDELSAWERKPSVLLVFLSQSMTESCQRSC